MHKTPFQLPYKFLSVGCRGPACSRIRDSRFHGTVKAEHQKKKHGIFAFYSYPSVTDPVESMSSSCIGENVTELFGFHCFFVLFYFLLRCASPIKKAKMGGRSNILNGIEIFENLLHIALVRRTKRFTLF